MRPNSPSVRRARGSAPVAPQRPYRAHASYLALQGSKGLETGHSSANAGSSLGEPRASAEQRRQSKALAGKSTARGAFWERSGLRLGSRGAQGILGAVPQRRWEDAEDRRPAARETEVRRPLPGRPTSCLSQRLRGRAGEVAAGRAASPRSSCVRVRGRRL